MTRSTFLLVCFIFGGVWGRNVEQPRLYGSYTKVIRETKVVTTLVPSSCVQVDENLPTCRSLRYLRFPSWGKSEDNSHKLRTEPAVLIHTTPLGWAEYLGIFAPTVTVTETEISTSTVLDPSIAVTFAIKGCRPLKLPLEMDFCPPEPSIFIEEVLPTSTISQIGPTSVHTLNENKSVEIVYDKTEGEITAPPSEDNVLEPSTEYHGGDYSWLIDNVQPTEPLQSVETAPLN